jgi:hypothetical protein
LDMINNGQINHTIIVSALYLYFLSEWSGLINAGNPLNRLV